MSLPQSYYISSLLIRTHLHRCEHGTKSPPASTLNAGTAVDRCYPIKDPGYATNVRILRVALFVVNHVRDCGFGVEGVDVVVVLTVTESGSRSKQIVPLVVDMYAN